MAVAPLSLANVQGDILFGLPKQAQSFLFFTVDNVDGFRSSLTNLVPLITTADQTKSNISEIRQSKVHNRLAVNEGDGEVVHPAFITVSGVNIAFSNVGLKKIGFSQDIQDQRFLDGMRNDTGLGGNFDSWDATFKQEIHGTLLVTGDSRDTVNSKLADVKNILTTTIKEVQTLNGDVRPGDQAGHEHFGYKDGISNPAVAGVDALNPGQNTIAQGTAFLGRETTPAGHPDWALDGSIMAFQKLPQLVPEFDKFLLDSAGSQDAADLMGARFVGRWKSGTPLVLASTQDDPSIADDPTENNNFKFTSGDQSACPFAAHIRKMNPRGDFSDDFISTHMILRRGIPFGPEVSDAEKASSTTQNERGLLFVCYQSQLANGFSFLQSAWANSPSFPSFQSPQNGLDPIIGQTPDGQRGSMTGAFANNTTKPLNLLAQWVNSKGGEYFFSPSISTLRDVFATKAS